MKYLMLLSLSVLFLSGCIQVNTPLPSRVPGVDYNVLHYMMSTTDDPQYIWGALMRNFRAEPIEFDIDGNPINIKDNGLVISSRRYYVKQTFYTDGRWPGYPMQALHDSHLEEPLQRYAEAYMTLSEAGAVTIYIVWNGEIVAQQTGAGDGTVIHLIWDDRP